MDAAGQMTSKLYLYLKCERGKNSLRNTERSNVSPEKRKRITEI